MRIVAFVLVLLCLLNVFSFIEAVPTNSMTRIQEVLRTLMGDKPHMASRGKKFYQEPLPWTLLREDPAFRDW